MSFKENLLKKIRIKSLASKVMASIGSPGSGAAIDKKSMRDLLKLCGCHCEKKRDIEFYTIKEDDKTPTMLVLDNELAIYKTTPDDVAMRKSPLIKEMANIRNIIKILNDKDVVVSKREESLEIVKREGIKTLDLSFDKSDIDSIAEDGRVAFEIEDAEGVLQSVMLFSELLGYGPPGKPFKILNRTAAGALGLKEDGEIVCGPIVIYDERKNSLKLVDKKIGAYDREKLQLFKNIAAGLKEPTIEGAKVFEYFKKNVMQKGD